jgi:hypothetical protein
MEMPVDVLTHRLGKMVDYGVNIPDPSAAAISIDEELQEKFYFIPKAEVDAVEVRDTHVVGPYELQAGDGPEACRANRADNPAWLYNSAVHALALMQHIKLEQERPKIPEPGVYLVTTVKSGQAHTAIVTEDRRVIVPQTGLGTMADKTFVFRNSETDFVWQRVDLATGDLLNG